MPEFQYARGRVVESIQYISEEMKEFDADYSNKTYGEYESDKKLQKLMDRTVENILTALIEVCGTVLTGEGIAVDSYSDAIRKTAKMFGFPLDEQDRLAGLAIQRNRLAHRYLNFRWQAIKMYKDQKDLFLRLLTGILEMERKALLPPI